jgi:hypothetical protein
MAHDPITGSPDPRSNRFASSHYDWAVCSLGALPLGTTRSSPPVHRQWRASKPAVTSLVASIVPASAMMAPPPPNEAIAIAGPFKDSPLAFVPEQPYHKVAK